MHRPGLSRQVLQLKANHMDFLSSTSSFEPGLPAWKAGILAIILSVRNTSIFRFSFINFSDIN